jgi:CRISPR type IV-associated protein Csf3
MSFKPFVAIAQINGPMQLSPKTVHLDGLLAFARVQQYLLATGKSDHSVGNELPLEKFSSNGQWVWKASLFHYEEPRVPARMNLNRTHPVNKASMLKDDQLGLVVAPRTVNTGGGAFKQRLFTDTVTHINRAIAVGVGDVSKVEELLQQITAIGQGRRHGYGRVQEWKVVELDDESSIPWTYRNLPVGTKSVYEHALAAGNLRAPYWSRGEVEHNRTKESECLIPTRAFPITKVLQALAIQEVHSDQSPSH